MADGLVSVPVQYLPAKGEIIIRITWGNSYHFPNKLIIFDYSNSRKLN